MDEYHKQSSLNAGKARYIVEIYLVASESCGIK